MEKVMIKPISSLIVAGIAIYSSIAVAAEKVTITEYLTKEIEVCSNAFKCEDIIAKELPDPSEVELVIEGYDKNEGYVMFQYKGKEMWVHQSEIEVSNKAFASVICSAQVISKTSDKSTYATLGLGEGCK
jgi:hypothetical protein